jgi:hypothetical protein
LLETALGLVLLIVCLCLGYLAFRRVRLMRGGGVDLCLRRRPAVVPRARDASIGWHAGVGRYRGDRMEFHRLTSFRPGASIALDRTELEILARRPPLDAESWVMPSASAVLRCRSGAADVELAMGPGVLTGFLAWLEAAPPGRGAGFSQAS